MEGLIEIQQVLKSRIKAQPYNERVADHEQSIRWKRTAAEVFDDGYYYAGKGCTDLTIVFLALCHALKCTHTRFVRVHDGNMFHSIAEVQLSDGWYIFDVAANDSQPEKGEIEPNKPYGRWSLLEKGQDPWDIGLDRMTEK